MKVLVTGCAGFIMSHFVNLLKDRGHDVFGIDAFIEGSCLKNVETFNNVPVECVRVEDLDPDVFPIWSFDYIVHGAALSNVDTSIKSPRAFEANIQATSNICWLATQYKIPILVVSTDEVYGSWKNSNSSRGFRETDVLNPSSAYAASKASSDLIALSYFKTYGADVRITRGANTYGTRQQDKLLPTIFKKLYYNEPVPIFRTLALRTWLHTYDHCSAFLTVMKKGKAGEIYNVTTQDEISPVGICDMLGVTDKIQFVDDRPGYDHRYFCSGDKLKELGWQPVMQLNSKGLLTLKDWYFDAFKDKYFD